jgi:ABC-type transport system involved in multi-copper enzyme maturation permease subunit
MFRKIMRWELSNITRFPILEIFVFLLVFNVFSLITGAGGGSSGTLQSWGTIATKVSENFLRESISYSIQVFLPLGLFASIFASLSFAYEMEKGTTKLYLSHPIDRTTLFAAKAFSLFLVLLSVIIYSVLLRTFFFDPSLFKYLQLLLICFLSVIFILSVTVFISVLTKNTAFSFVGSFFIIYVLTLIRSDYVPPRFFFVLNDHLNKGLCVSDLGVPLISVLLLLFSYYLFKRGEFP